MAFPNGLSDLIEIFALQGINQAVICPGSRNAPIMLALTRNKNFTCYSISDERSAAFFGLGLAQKTKKPVVLCCTSGSAGLNMAPAVAEAFFQEIPLIVLTADRPKEWIEQWDGQTIFQANLFGPHAKKALEFPTQASSEKDFAWYQNRIANEAALIAQKAPKGPVHINIPISEPFYPGKEDEIPSAENTKIIQAIEGEIAVSKEMKWLIQQSLSQNPHLMITVGQLDPDPEIQELLIQLNALGIPVIGDATANIPESIQLNHDLILSNDLVWRDLAADVVIHIGKSFVSKRIKQFIRRYPAAQQWWIDPNNSQTLKDPFQNLSHVITIPPAIFLRAWIQEASKMPITKAYGDRWKQVDQEVKAIQKSFFESGNWSEIHLLNDVFKHVKAYSGDLHVANSLAVRYINWTAENVSHLNVFANRGTSGIDGCLSTAVGAAQASNDLVISLIGDVAFQYDRNALWNQYLPANLRIIVLNNQGGGIFRNLEGAKDLPELETYMETEQRFTAKNTALDAGITYFNAKNEGELAAILPGFFEKSQTAQLLEIETNSIQNAEQLKAYMSLFKG
jgi:2-succinyl-5-enolpyruvyl-6-hydroxy-3-cyclohexene-1-carboxylate synthase